MGCRRVAALHLVPLLARLVLATAFIPAGWGKVMVTSTVEGPEAATIRELLASPWAETPPSPEQAEAGDPASMAQEPMAKESMEAPLEIRNVLHLAVDLEAAGAPRPVVLAWMAAITELVGGGLLVIGLLSRVWAMGLLIVMGVAFALTSLDPILASGPFDLGRPEYIKAVAQLALGTLALGVVLTGAGAMSIDHAIFGGGGRRSDPLDDD